MNIEAYRHHLYFILIVFLTGLILQEVIKRLIKSLDTDSRKNSVKTATTPLSFFYKIGGLFSWTASIYFGCKLFYANFLSNEIFGFLAVIIRIEAVVLVMFFLSHGINHLLKNILANSNKDMSHDRRHILQAGDGKSSASAVINALAWSAAFLISAMALNLILFSSIINIIFLAVIILCLLFFVYRYSEEGHQLVTGIIGYFYLRDVKNFSDFGKPFRLMLEDGEFYEVKKISLFHTSFIKEEGVTEIRNNSLIMILNFGFKPWKERAIK